jgi:RNA polymerase sigma factor (sigma-70 family)
LLTQHRATNDNEVTDEQAQEREEEPDERSLPLRSGVRVSAPVCVRRIVRLRKAGRLTRMDAPALLAVLIPERARFVRLARARVGTDADAEDVVQRSLARAAAHVASLGDPQRARAWFYRILRRAIVDHHRARAAEPARSDEEPEIADEQSLEPTRTPCVCAVRLLGELRPAYAEVIRRVDVEEGELAAVAEALGISVGNLHVRLHRARRLLRDEVKHHCGVATHRPCLDCTCDAQRRCSGHSR